VDTIYELRELSIADVSKMALVHLNSFSGSVMSKLGKEIVGRYYLWQFTDIERFNKVVHALGVYYGDELVAFSIFGLVRNATIGFLRKNWMYLSLITILKIYRFSFYELKEILWNFGYLLKKFAEILFNKKQKSTNISQTKSRESYGILVTACKKEHEGRGLGTLLMKRAELIAKEAGAPSIHLSVRENNINAWKIYEALGYKKVTDVNGNWISKSMIKYFNYESTGSINN